MSLKKIARYIPNYLFLLAVLLNITAWNSPSFCDFYAAHCFPIAVELYGRFMGLFSFSLGEWLLLLAAAAVLAVPCGGMVCLAGRRLYPWYRRYLRVFGWLAGAACLIMTLNCLILYHCSPISTLYGEAMFHVEGMDSIDGGALPEREYSVAELGLLRDYVVEAANELAGLLPRDEQGYLLPREDLIPLAREQMRRLGEEYPRLAGYYPRPKPLFSSSFFSQQYICGYYFPFSMEANYNTKMYITNIPTTLCHELSHLKGFIYEDEANFIAYLACVEAEDVLFRYSAYLSVIGYLDRDFYESLGGSAELYREHPAVSELVKRDDIFLTPEAWETVEEKALLDTELVREVSGDFMEANLTLNGVADGRASYGRVVELLLLYYDGVLWD